MRCERYIIGNVDSKLNDKLFNVKNINDFGSLVEIVLENEKLKKEVESLKSCRCTCSDRYEVIPNLDENFVGIWDKEIEEFIKTMSINGNSPYDFKLAREELSNECEQLNENQCECV